MLLDTPICEFGRPMPKFDLKTPRGDSYTFDKVMGKNGLLVAFICNHCPYVKAVIERLVADAHTLIKQEGIGVVAIMPNNYEKYPDDSPEMMQEFVQTYHITFPYLVDETQEVARDYDAICTPDFFGLNIDGQLQYRGRLDNARMENASDRKPELLEAMRIIAQTGRGPEEQMASMGCSIKWK